MVDLDLPIERLSEHTYLQRRTLSLTRRASPPSSRKGGDRENLAARASYVEGCGAIAHRPFDTRHRCVQRNIVPTRRRS
jgi:hypothetical protein